MPIRNKQVKQKTRVDKITSAASRKTSGKCGRLKSTELPSGGTEKYSGDAAQVPTPYGSQSRRAKNPSSNKKKENDKVTCHLVRFVPVQTKTGKTLMPCRPARARELVGKGRAQVQYHKNFFFIKLLDRAEGKVQDVCLGIDPGSKREAFTVKSTKHTYLNILADSVGWVKSSVETKRTMRRTRRLRKTPCRKNRENRSRGGMPPSTGSRWNWKLRISKVLMKLYPINSIVVEDIQARTMKNGRKWNVSFSPLEVGKEWFYSELRKLCPELILRTGYYTKNCRDMLGLKKTHSKLENKFSAHNVDSWVLANDFIGGHNVPDNTSIKRMLPLQYSRRQLHRLQASEGGLRKRYGGTKSLGLTRGMLVKHTKHGICFVGGCSDTGVSLHNIKEGKRLTQSAKLCDLELLCYNSFRHFDLEDAK